MHEAYLSASLSLSLSQLADGSITRKGEKEKKRKKRRGEKGRIIAKSGYSSDTLPDHSSAIDSREERGRENLTLRRADPFSTKNSTRFVSSVIRFVFNSGLIGFSREGGFRRFDLRAS